MRAAVSPQRRRQARWLAEPLDRVIAHYLALLAHAFLPVATERGRAALLPYLDGVLAGPSSRRGRRG